LSWTLNVNINIIGIREIKHTAHTYRFIFYYKFQNSLLKLLKYSNNINSINVIIYKKKYYILHTANIFPTLINLPALTEITFQNKRITSECIKNIIDNNFDQTFPFSIKIYTSYSYIKTNSEQLSTNMIGQYIHENESSNDILYIFVTPTIERNILYIHQLTDIKNSVFNRQNLFNISKGPEGNQINYCHSKTQSTMNQKYCACQHEETYSMSPPKKYNHLGIL
jgi:hypothetical protein